MEELFKDPVQLSKGIKMQDLINGQTEFHIDMDFKKKSTGMMLNCDDDLLPDMDDDSDSEDVLKNIDTEVEKMMLSCPEYHSFKDLSSKMIDCVSTGEVKMLIIEEGDGPLVPVDSIVTLHYAAYFEKTKIPFDSSLTMNNGAPLRLRLGRGRILTGLEVGLTAVKGPKARFHLLLQPSMTWGSQGALPRIRPELALFVIILYQVEDVQAAVRFNDLPKEEQHKFEVTLSTVESLHTHSKDLFQKKKYKKAVKNYQQSLYILNISQPTNETEIDIIKKFKVHSYVNLAVCYYKLNKPKYVINMCEALDYIIDIEKNCKALFYLGRANEMLGKHEEAIKYYKKALKLKPKDKDIGHALAKLDKYILDSAEQERVMWQMVFQSAPEKKTLVYDIDEDFKNDVREMCQSMVEQNVYSKFELPNGLTRDEVECIKDLSSQFEGLVVLEDGKGKNKKISVVRKSLP